MQPLQYLPEDDDASLLQDNSGSIPDFALDNGSQKVATNPQHPGVKKGKKPARSESSLSISSDSGSDSMSDSGSDFEEWGREHLAHSSKRPKRASTDGNAVLAPCGCGQI